MTKIEDREFLDALKESIDVVPRQYGDKNGEKPYYSSDYKIRLSEMVKSVSPLTNVRKDINSMSSSARFAALDFVNWKNVEFEKAISNDIPGSKGPTFMDVVIGNTFFECKCHEILDTKAKLLGAYKSSPLFEELIGKENIAKCVETIGNDGKEYITYPMKEFDIDLDENNWCKLYFDFKQLICHVIALANNYSECNSVLQYVIYKPSEASIEKRRELKRVYLELEKEIKAIWRRGNRITDFCRRHNIYLAAPIFKNVNHIDDFVLRELIKSN